MRRIKFRSPATALVPLEATVHATIAAWLKVVLPSPWISTTFPAGGGGRVRGAHLKRMGLLAGMPDLLLLSPSGDWRGLEIKRPGKAKNTSDAQDDLIRWAGGRIAVVTSVDEAKAALQRWGVLA